MVKPAKLHYTVGTAPYPVTVHLGVIFRAIWVVVKIMVPFWIPIIKRPLIFGVPKKGP